MPKKPVQLKPNLQPNPRNQPCFCGSGLKHKDCCETLQKEVQEHLTKFDQIINSELERIINKQNLNRKNLVISRRPVDCYELIKVFYIKNKYDLLKVTSPPLPVVKSKADLLKILTVSPDLMETKDLTVFLKPEISIIMQNEIATTKAEDITKG